jgi:hypothetical protein
MFIILARRTTTTTTIITMIVVARGLCTTIVIPLSLESPRITKMLFILSLAIITTGHTRRWLFLGTMTMFTSDDHPTITITTTITTTMGTRK